jgi:hypothetical protein
MTDHDLARRIEQAITLKDAKQVRALLGQAQIGPQSSWVLMDAVKAAAVFLTPMSPTTVDVGTVTEYGLTQKLSRPIRCF